MSFIGFLALAASLVLAGGPGYGADAKRSAGVASEPQSMAVVPSGAEQVGKLLAERSGASDPDVPLPQRDLVPSPPTYVPLGGPSLYGRRDEGSVVLGLKIPIPADRRATQ